MPLPDLDVICYYCKGTGERPPGTSCTACGGDGIDDDPGVHSYSLTIVGDAWDKIVDSLDKLTDIKEVVDEIKEKVNTL